MSASQWTAEELELRTLLEAGETVVGRAPMRGHTPHKRLVAWAREQGRYTYIGRPPRGFLSVPKPGEAKGWGNPFPIGPEASRDAVCDSYAAYLQTQPQLLARLPELKGQLLGCFCSPLRCHGDHLRSLAEVTEVTVRQFSGLSSTKRESRTNTETGSVCHFCHCEHTASSAVCEAPTACAVPELAYPDVPTLSTRLGTRLGKPEQDLPESLERATLQRWLKPRQAETYSSWSARYDTAHTWAREQAHLHTQHRKAG